MFTGMKDLATAGQLFVQNEIMSSNEVRSKIGLKPRDTERANDLLNKNINKVEDISEIKENPDTSSTEESQDKNFNNELDTSNFTEEDRDG